MRIDSIKTTPDRSGRFLVKFDTGIMMKLYRQTVEDFGLFPGMELSQERFQALEQNAGAYSAKMRAVRIVSATSISGKNLEKRLVQKGEDPLQARQAVEWMEDLHLVDDRQTAIQLVRQCIRKGYGKSRARQVLYEKQIPREFWDDALEDYPDQEDYILKFLRTKLPENPDPKAVKRAIDALMRRGHGYRAIRSALDRLGADSEEFLEDI